MEKELKKNIRIAPVVQKSNYYVNVQNLIIKILNNSVESITEKDFSDVFREDAPFCYSWMSDYLIYKCFKKLGKNNISSLNVTGQHFLTDQGIVWLSQLLESCPGIKKILLNGCSEITEIGLFHLLNVLRSPSQLAMYNTSVKYLPDNITRYHEISGYGSGCATENRSDRDAGFYPLIIWSSEQVKISSTAMLCESVERAFQGHYFEQMSGVRLFPKLPKINIVNYGFTEVPMYPIIPTRPGQIVIVVNDDKNDAEQHVVETIAHFLTRDIIRTGSPFYKFTSKSQLKSYSKPVMKMKQKKKGATKNDQIMENSPDSSLIEEDNMYHQGLEIEDNEIIKVGSNSHWVSKDEFSDKRRSFTVTVANSANPMNVGVQIGICPFDTSSILHKKAVQTAVVCYDFNNVVLKTKNKTLTIPIDQKKNGVSKFTINFSASSKAIAEADNNSIINLASIEMDDELIWSHSIAIDRQKKYVPFFTFQNSPNSIKISGDWFFNLSNDSDFVKTDLKYQTQFVTISHGANSVAVVDSIKAFDWKEKLRIYKEKILTIKKEIKMKSVSSIDSSDIRKLSLCKSQLASMDSFIGQSDKRMKIFSVVTIDETSVCPILKEISNNIEVQIEVEPYKYHNDKLNLATEQFIEEKLNYVSWSSLEKMDLIENSSQFTDFMFQNLTGFSLSNSRIFIRNLSWFDGFLSELVSEIPFEANYKAQGLHMSAKVWTIESLGELFTKHNICENDFEKMLQMLLDLGIFISIPCIRYSPTDEQCFFVNPMVGSAAKFPQLEEIRKSKNSSTKKVIATVKYNKISQDIYSIYPVLLARIVHIGILQLLSPIATVIHIDGGAELIIEAGETSIEICVYSPLPPELTGKDCFELNTLHYLWSIMHLCTDAMDSFIVEHNLLVEKTESSQLEQPHNYSVGYQHNWNQSNEKNNHGNICTLCCNCSAGDINAPNLGKCTYNRISSRRRGYCLCMRESQTCLDCGICEQCAKQHWVYHCKANPNQFISREDSIVIPRNVLNAKSPTFHFQTFANEIKAGLGLKRKSTKETIIISTSVYVIPNSESFEKEQFPFSVSFYLEPLPFTTLYRRQFDYNVCHLCHLVQDWGLLSYNHCLSPEIRVGIFSSKSPISRQKNKFAIEIINPGLKSYISIGLVPANYPLHQQPGWKEKSIAYHGDDGGIYDGGGSYKKQVDKFNSNNDIIEVEVEFQDFSKGNKSPARFIIFRKNGVDVYRQKLVHNIEYFAAVGLHSKYEQVRLLQFPIWESDKLDREVNHDSFKLGEDLEIFPKETIRINDNNLCYGLFHLYTKSKVKSVQFENPLIKNTDKKLIKEVEIFSKRVEIVKSDLINFVGSWKTTYEYLTFMLALEQTDNPKSKEHYQIGIVVEMGSGQRYNWKFNLQSVSYTPIESDEAIRLMEVENTKEAPLFPSLVLHTTVNLSSKSEDTIKRTYYIEKDEYQLCYLGSLPDCWIRCDDFVLPNVTRSFQIGNLLQYKNKLSMILENIPDENKIKISNCTNMIQYSDFNLSLLSSPGKQIICLEDSNDLKSKQFVLTNSTLLKYPPPSRPWHMLINLEFDGMNTIIDGMYFSLKCKEYHGLNIQLVRCLSRSKTKDDPLLSIVTLPLNKKLVENTELLLWEHSLMDLLKTENFTFFLLCLGLSKNHDAYPHLLDTEGQANGTKMTNEMHCYRSIFFNPSLTETHKLLINNKFILQNYQKLLPQKPTSLSAKETEYLVFTIMEKVTSFMLINNLLCDPKLNYSEDIKIDVADIIENSDSSLVAEGKFAVCKMHYNQEEIDVDQFLNENKVLPDSILSDPILKYSGCLDSVTMVGRMTQSISPNFFTKFGNLKSLKLKNFLSLKDIPESIYYLKGLQRLIFDKVQCESLPSPSKFPVLKYYLATHCSSLKFDPCSQTNKLGHMKLEALSIGEFPKEFCDFVHLTSLELQLNGLNQLPDEFAQLHLLVNLKITGSDLYYQLGSGIIKPNQKFENLKLEVTETNKYQVINESNYTANVEFLSPSECFINIPRFGLGYSRSFDVSGSGGFPLCIFELKQLKYLTINHQAIRFLPADISKLTQLEILNLDCNLLLHDIALEVTDIETLKNISLLHLPSLSTLSSDIIARGSNSVLAFLKFLKVEKVHCNRAKLMFVGLGEAGKTSLLTALMSENNKVNVTSTDKDSKSVTDGIDITQWNVPVPNTNENIQFSTWDFAGQDVYYNTHQFFLSSKSIYIVVWSVRQGIEHGDLDFWLSSISCHAKDAPVFVVGTRCDQVETDLSSFMSLKSRYDQIVDFLLVDSFSGTNIAKLKEKIIETTMKQPYMNQDVPSSIIDLEKKIIQKRSKEIEDADNSFHEENNSISFIEFKSLAMMSGILEKDVKNVIEVLQGFGTIQYFDTEMLKSRVVINPQWIVDIMANVVSVVDKKIDNGYFYHSKMVEVWNNYPAQLHQWMLNLTEEFDLTYPHPTLEPKANIVPCLLPEEEPEIKWPIISVDSGWKYSQIFYKFAFLPAGLFNRIQVRLFDITDSKEIWKFGSYFIKNNHHVLFKRENKNNLTIRAIGVNPVNILAIIDEVIRSLIRLSFHGVAYSMDIPCPDCIEEGKPESENALKYWSNISMIPSTTVSKATSKKVEYIQCQELHINSIKSLRDNNPETASPEDFITDLKSKVKKIEGLTITTKPYISILYSEKDFEGKTLLNMKDFEEIFKSLNIACHRLSNIALKEWKKKIMSSKVCVIILTENLKSHESMEEVLKYIGLMKKDFLLVIFSNDTNQLRQTWKFAPYFNNMFIKINTTETDLYQSRFENIKSSLKELINNDSDETISTNDIYDCFISYCWKNSYDASKKSSGAVNKDICCAAADPRHLKKYLTSQNIICWIDEAYLNKKAGLSSQLFNAIQRSKIMIAFVSKEYDKSENCKMELRYMLEILHRPVVFVNIDRDIEALLKSEIAMLMSKGYGSKIINFSAEELVVKEDLLKVVKETLANSNIKPFINKDSSENSEKSALDEQVELIFRQFLNQLVTFSQEHCPRLIVIDIEDVNLKSTENDEKESDNLNSESNPPTNTNWIIRVICEKEGGWHTTDDKFDIPNEEREGLISRCSTYLSILYEVLQYRNPGLRCLQNITTSTSDSGSLMNIVTKAAASSDVSLHDSYRYMISFYLKQEQQRGISNCLQRYRLPSGSELWMCEKDKSEYSRIRLIPRDSALRESQINPIAAHDTQLLQNIEAKSADEIIRYGSDFKAFSLKDQEFSQKKESDVLSTIKPVLKRPEIIRQDTVLQMEKEMVTYSSSSTKPYKPNLTTIKDVTDASTTKTFARKDTNRTVLLPKRRESVSARTEIKGSRICILQ